MRKIYFRGKRVDNGEWVTGHLLWFEDGGAVITPSHTDVRGLKKDEETLLCHLVYEVIPKTVGQYTGLTDKNGTKIFEGDILSERPLMNSVAYVGCVKYSDENSAFEIVFDTGSSFVLGSYSRSYTVIGNLHDNPELLKGGTDNG